MALHEEGLFSLDESENGKQAQLSECTAESAASSSSASCTDAGLERSSPEDLSSAAHDTTPDCPAVPAADAVVSAPPAATAPAPANANAAVDLARRVVPVQTIDEDVCAICLDEFTTEDPANDTSCGHAYHLQCIMQWAQRSHECPMCFKPLALQDQTLNELLPFGEYRPPEQEVPAHTLLGLDAWELDRLLARLAVHGNSNSRRARGSRSSSRSTARAEAARMYAESAGAAGPSAAASRQQAAASPIAMPRESSAHAAASGADIAYPASWPPANHSRTYSLDTSASGAGDHEGERPSPALELRRGWAAVSSRAKEGFKEIRSLWGRSAAHGTSSDAGQSPAATSSTAT